MRSVLVSAAVLGVVHLAFVPATPARPASGSPADDVAPAGEGADGGRGAVLMRAGAAPLLAPAEARQSPLVAVGEGGEGGRGKKGRGRGWDRRHAYPEPYRFRAERYPPFGWVPAERYQFAPSPYRYAPPPRYGWEALPPRYAPAPAPGGWIDPGS
jgi:hypothetical protein